jgi:hypothetical protein
VNFARLPELLKSQALGGLGQLGEASSTAQDLRTVLRYNSTVVLSTWGDTTMQQLQLGIFTAAVTVLVVCGCIFTRKPKKGHDVSLHSIALAVTLATLMSISPQKASAKGGTFHLWTAWSPVSRAEAATHSSRPETMTETLGAGCGGKRYRDQITHRCRGPADFGY